MAARDQYGDGTVLTFLAVFLIQNTQNRNDLATQLKLDELLRAIETARSGLIDLEDATDEEIATLRREFQRLHQGKGADAKHKPAGSTAAPSS
jgi:low affinity Fe/Cu permease